MNSDSSSSEKGLTPEDIGVKQSGKVARNLLSEHQKIEKRDTSLPFLETEGSMEEKFLKSTIFSGDLKYEPGNTFLPNDAPSTQLTENVEDLEQESIPFVKDPTLENIIVHEPLILGPDRKYHTSLTAEQRQYLRRYFTNDYQLHESEIANLDEKINGNRKMYEGRSIIKLWRTYRAEKEGKDWRSHNDNATKRSHESMNRRNMKVLDALAKGSSDQAVIELLIRRLDDYITTYTDTTDEKVGISIHKKANIELPILKKLNPLWADMIVKDGPSETREARRLLFGR